MLFQVGNGSHSLWDRDEPRYAVATHEMITGGDWIVPYFNGRYRFDKPILVYWLRASQCASPTPESRFGNSFSCPFIVFTQGSEGEDYVIVVPPGALVLTTYPPILVTVETVTLTPTPLPIRRLRRSQHLSTDGLLAFYSRFQLDLEAGVGLTTGQGEDPQLMLRWSDDGGHTWSNDHWVSAGKIGEYLRRAGGGASGAVATGCSR